MAKIALLIGVSEYEPGLDGLPAAVNDVAAMQQVLANPNMGDFADAAVTVLQNSSRQAMEDALYRLFADRQREDLVLLYFSGHGVVDESGEFYFTTRFTRKEAGRLVPTTAVAARSVREWMEQSRSQHKVIILDSCFSGAFARGVKAKDSGSINPEQFLGGKGTAILTASTSTQYALTQEGFDLSIYTHYLVEGIRTGGADRDDDGFIGAEELHAYASSKVKEAAPAMTPEFYPVKEGYRILLAKSPKDDPTLKYRKQVEQRADQGVFSIPARRLLNSLRLQLQIAPEVAAAIEAEVLQPYRDFQRKLQEYEETLVEAWEAEKPLSPRSLRDLADYQQHLALEDADVQPIQARVMDAVPPAVEANSSSQPFADGQLQRFEFEVITVDPKGKEKRRAPKSAEFVTEDLGNGVQLELVKLPAGTFQMGSPAGEGDNDEKPQHAVKLPAFLIGKYPVTQAQWRSIAALPQVQIELDADPAGFKGDRRPVENVSWEEAMEFCARLSQACLSQKGDRQYRLPSEAEWEYACRAGTTTPFCFGETITTDLANYRGTDWKLGDETYPGFYGQGSRGSFREETTDVGTFPPNAFGLYDMHGNVWEWCADRWHNNYGGAPTDGTAWIDGKSEYRIIRGGSWFDYPAVCRAAHRHFYSPGDRVDSLGFRVVCSVFPGFF